VQAREEAALASRYEQFKSDSAARLAAVQKAHEQYRTERLRGFEEGSRYAGETLTASTAQIAASVAAVDAVQQDQVNPTCLLKQPS
jgi:hypothetical protein